MTQQASDAIPPRWTISGAGPQCKGWERPFKNLPAPAEGQGWRELNSALSLHSAALSPPQVTATRPSCWGPERHPWPGLAGSEAHPMEGLRDPVHSLPRPFFSTTAGQYQVLSDHCRLFLTQRKGHSPAAVVARSLKACTPFSLRPTPVSSPVPAR